MMRPIFALLVLSSRKIKSVSRVILLMVFILMTSKSTFPEGEANEYNIKALFVLNFMKYVEWPTRTDESTFNIAVAGESEIFNALVTMTTNRQENKKIQIEKIEPESNDNFQILIITRNENIEEWVKKYQGRGTLIISEDSKSIKNTSINLMKVNNKIRFEINYSQAKRDGIKISSRLAEMAISVQQ